MSPMATRRTPCAGLKHVVHGAGATAAAADETDLDFVAARGVRARNHQAGGHRAAHDGRGCLDEVTPRRGGCLLISLVHNALQGMVPAVHSGGGLTTYSHFDELSNSATTRKPTKVASVCHHKLFGFCGSRRLHASIDERRAALLNLAGASSQDPPRAA